MSHAKVTILPEAAKQMDGLPDVVREAVYGVLFDIQEESSGDVYVGRIYISSAATISN